MDKTPLNSDRDGDHKPSFNADLQSLISHSQEIEKMLSQTLQVLSKLGNKPPFSAEAILQRGQEGREKLQTSSQHLLHEVDELRELVRTSALITTSLEIDQVLDEVMDTVINLTGAERAYLMLLKAEDDLTVRAARNNQGAALNDEGITFSSGVIKRALADGQPIISTNAQEDERFQEMHSVIRHDLRSIMVIPMLLQGLPIGVLYLDNRLAAQVFQKASIPLLTAFANQAAIAIENARLFERVQRSLERTKREVKQLRVQLDEQKLKTQVLEITSSDYFQELASMAKNMRERGANNET